MRALAFVGVLTLSITAHKAGQALTCSIGSTAGIALGSVNVLSGAAVDSTGSFAYRCDDVSLSDSIVIQFDRGNSISYVPRTLLQGPYELEYNLYLNVARTTVWGDGSSGTGQLGPFMPAEGVETSVNVYGRIDAGQNAHQGQYSDTVTITVVF